MQHDTSDGYATQQADRCVVAAFPYLYPVLPSGGARRLSAGADGKVIRPDDALVRRDTVAQLQALGNG